MSTRARYLGAAGTIVDGRIRDLQEHQDLEYTVRYVSNLLPKARILIPLVQQVFARDVGTTSPQEMLRVGEVG